MWQGPEIKVFQSTQYVVLLLEQGVKIKLNILLLSFLDHKCRYLYIDTSKPMTLKLIYKDLTGYQALINYFC